MSTPFLKFFSAGQFHFSRQNMYVQILILDFSYNFIYNINEVKEDGKIGCQIWFWDTLLFCYVYVCYWFPIHLGCFGWNYNYLFRIILYGRVTSAGGPMSQKCSIEYDIIITEREGTTE